MAAPRTSVQPRPRRIRGLDAEQRRAQRREQLLAAAFELFARDGYANTSIEEICQTAYVGNKAFYDLFDTKEDCYLALLRQVSERIEDQVAQAMRESIDADEEETVRRVLSAFAHTLVDDPRVAMVTFGVAAGISPRVEAQRWENRRWAASFIEAFWRRNHPSGEIDYRALAVATVGGLFETVTDWLHEADPPRSRTFDDLISELTTFMLVVEAGIHARGR
ncbi:MAG TPA: TetR/AcrR family transcriptional regulator [Mycobacterium sp.]|uniref:TetR/AcrR family transcriptional regulator n=1 Tax=Mycobacterium sp. TaxID=1785 RepID=UPI002BDB10E3|nr:TetR/AcrR family transcriptional regulator [Mycobacterium sp.]HME79090.1 TetR/AcrR family transcriptional regulator [Mycobacterium sp.]